jgi:hypothetical protein
MKKLLVFIIIIFSICLTPIFIQAETCRVEKIIGAQVQIGTYKITTQEIYIKTQMCLNLSLGDDAILDIQSPYGFGELHFLGY